MQDLEEKKKRMEEEMQVQTAHATHEERKRLIDSHEAKLLQMEQEVHRKKMSDEEVLRQKLEARKKKKQAHVQKKQEEELSRAEKKGQDLSGEIKKQMKAKAFAELRKMVLDGKYPEALAVLRQTQEQETKEMLAHQSKEFVTEMAALPDGTRFTCFTSTKSTNADTCGCGAVCQALTRRLRSNGSATSTRCSVYLRYWYKRTNSDTCGTQLLVQKYKN